MKTLTRIRRYVTGLVQRLKATDPPRHVRALATFAVLFMPLGIATTAVVLPLYVRHRERQQRNLIRIAFRPPLPTLRLGPGRRGSSPR